MATLRRSRIFTATIVTAALFACGGPWGPFPGGRLAGPEAPFPDSGFAFARDVQRLAVEVGGAEPRSVHTWAIVLGAQLFLPADFFNPGKRWPHLAMANPNARLRIDGWVHRGRLTRVQDEATIEALRVETARKYGIGEESWAARIDVWWFRFDPPQPHGDANRSAKRRQPSR